MQQQLLEDVVLAATRIHNELKSITDINKRKEKLNGYPWTLAPLTVLHAHTGDQKYLQWAHEGLVWMVDSAILPDGSIRPQLGSFRLMQPFCEAFLYLQKQNVLTSEETTRIQAQIATSANTHLDSTDWGAQNRATVDAAGFYFASVSVPHHSNATRWKHYGDALIEDSWGRWSIEDASIYGPFWLFYLMTTADLQGRSDEFMNFVTTRYYFEFYRGLLAPNGMLPEWGDGDWTHMWHWYMATMVRAGSEYQNGEYLYFAKRLYETHREMGLREPIHGFLPAGLEEGDGLYCAGTALRWLDTSVEMKPYTLPQSEELVDDLVSKKIIFRNDKGNNSSYAFLNYRDQGPYGRYQRDYQNQQLAAYEEKPHHGHGDENAINLLMDHETVLLADGGYRRTPHDGWRADLYHNKIVARLGWPINHDVMHYLQQNRSYSPVLTEKIHFGNFGPIDYSRTRLIDDERGYTTDRILLFLVQSGVYIIVDAIHIDREGRKLFANMWHPSHIIENGNFATENEHWMRSWSPQVPVRQDHWTNPHNKELLIEFLDNRDKYTQIREIDRCYNPSQAFFQFVYSHFFKGQRLAFVTVLTPHNPGQFNKSMLGSVQVIHDAERSCRTLGLRFKHEGSPVTVGLKLDQTIGLTNLRGRPLFDWKTGQVTYDNLQTDAEFAFVKDNGTEADIGFIYGSQLTYKNKTLFDMPINQHMYQGAVEEYRVPDIKDKMPRWRETITL